MQNTACSACTEPGRASRMIRVLGTEFAAKDAPCRRDGSPPAPSRERIRLQLSIRVTDSCGCSCPFCIAGGPGSGRSISLTHLEKVLRALREEDVVRGISFTGGEPFTDTEKLDAAVHMVFEIFGYGLEVSISTNGSGIGRLEMLRDIVHIESIHISRHHYDDAVNRRLFGGGSVPLAAELKSALHALPFPDLFVFNCLLLRAGIGTPEEAHRFLDFALDAGAGKVGFITGSPVNDYVRAQTVDYRDVLRDDDPSLLFTQGFTDRDWCRCRDGVYCSGDGRLIEFYGRSTQASGCPYARGMVYDTDGVLRAGYGSPVVIAGA